MLRTHNLSWCFRASSLPLGRTCWSSKHVVIKGFEFSLPSFSASWLVHDCAGPRIMTCTQALPQFPSSSFWSMDYTSPTSCLEKANRFSPSSVAACSHFTCRRKTSDPYFHGLGNMSANNNCVTVTNVYTQAKLNIWDQDIRIDLSQFHSRNSSWGLWNTFNNFLFCLN